MEVTSKIKSVFDKEMRQYIAAICDTRQIQNNIEKMDLLQRLLTTRKIPSEQIGGATNRYVVMIDGYAFKIAVDRQGYKDNLMEYGLTKEVPHTTKSYETNGYMLVQQCVRILTLEEWRVRKVEILKILDELGREYLLGDVGYDDINRTNWGVTDEGDLVILDYAYCHRLTEDLFTCPICGSVLSYDQNFTSFLCTDRANCHARYSYNQIKARQGDTVDWEMIKDRKSRSIVIPADKTSINVERSSDLLLDSSTFVIRSYRDMAKYKEVKNMLKLNYSDPKIVDLVTRLTYAKARPVPDKGKIEELEAELEEYRKDIPTVKCIIDPEFEERVLERDGYLPALDDEESAKEFVEEDVSRTPFELLLEKARAGKKNNSEADEDDGWNESAEVETSTPVTKEESNDPFNNLIKKARESRNNVTTESVYTGDIFMDTMFYEQGVQEENEKPEEPKTEAPKEKKEEKPKGSGWIPERVRVLEEETPTETDTKSDDDTIGEPDSELEDAVEDDLLPPPPEDDAEESDDTDGDVEESNNVDQPAEDDAEESDDVVSNDDIIGEPDSELEDAVEDDLLPPPENWSEDDPFTTEPVNDYNGDDTDEDSFAIGLDAEGDADVADPETVIIDDELLTNNALPEENYEE